MKQDYDVIVIGGGILGCFALRNLMRYNVSALMIERREDICSEITRSNLAVVYNGCDTKLGSIKNELCVRGNKNFGDVCAELGVEFSRCGSLMVCYGENGKDAITKKYEKGISCGIPGLKLISGDEARALEPGLSDDVIMALYSPSTGTVTPWELGIAAAENAVNNGADIICGEEVIGMDKTESGYTVHTNKSTYFARGIVNCSGINADKIHKFVSDAYIKIHTTGSELMVFTAEPPKHVIFSEQEDENNVTIVPTVHGEVLVGSTTSPYGRGYYASREGMFELESMIKRVMPSFPLETKIRSFGAVRPEPYKAEDKKNNDLSILDEGTLISFAGIKTPGLTCSSELGILAADNMAAALGAQKNPDFDPIRKPKRKVSEMPPEEWQELAKEHPEYANVVCLCKTVTEGEIIDSIKSGASTLSGVKHRTNACMGKCQGARCSCKIEALLSEVQK